MGKMSEDDPQRQVKDLLLEIAKESLTLNDVDGTPLVDEWKGICELLDKSMKHCYEAELKMIQGDANKLETNQGENDEDIEKHMIQNDMNYNDGDEIEITEDETLGNFSWMI